jgi:hypothetical protein
MTELLTIEDIAKRFNGTLPDEPRHASSPDRPPQSGGMGIVGQAPAQAIPPGVFRLRVG